MEEVRERIIYKNTPIEICLKQLTSIEQYELVRLLAIFPGKSVRVCTHENTSSYIDTILKRLRNVTFFHCFSVPVIAPSTNSATRTTQ
jgi:hypothetical protein